jgi:hypothetical protein
MSERVSGPIENKREIGEGAVYFIESRQVRQHPC